MRRRGFLSSALALPLVLALPGCASDYRSRAQKLADEVFPGRLTVLDVVTDVGGPVPVPTRSVLYRVVEDSDACVELDRLEADALRSAYDLARRAAAELRLLAAALSGFTVRGYSHSVNDDRTSLSCYVETAVSDTTMTRVEADLDAALSAWLASRTARADPYAVGRLTGLRVGLVEPAAAARVPSVAADQPLVRRLSFKKRADALASAAVASSSVSLDHEDRLDSVTQRMQTNPNTVAERRGVEISQAAVVAWLGANRPDLVTDGEDVLSRRLRPGSASQLRLYFRSKASGSIGPDADALVAVTFDLERAAAGDIQLLKRPATGWPEPIEPNL